MLFRTLIHATELSERDTASIQRNIPGELIAHVDHYRVLHDRPVAAETLAELRQALAFDINPLPADFEPERVCLIVSDMDSTLISIECIDELADQLGLKAQVAAITDAAMRGELVFADALNQRVALLAGLPESFLQSVYDDRLRFNPGAETLMSEARDQGIKTAVVSGGFTFFTERVKARLGLDFAQGNQLEVENGVLTGRVIGPICGAEAKAAFLARLRDELDLEDRQCIAIGDGANDLPMLETAGIGIAYHAKPKLQQAADALLNHAGLDAVTHFFRADR
jgi:phosphoserine phosphatase